MMQILLNGNLVFCIGYYHAHFYFFNFSKERFDVGLMNSFDFSQSSLAYENAQSEVLRTKYDYIFRTKILEFYFGIPLIKNQ